MYFQLLEDNREHTQSETRDELWNDGYHLLSGNLCEKELSEERRTHLRPLSFGLAKCSAGSVLSLGWQIYLCCHSADRETIVVSLS